MMDKATMIYLIIEAIIFLIPVASLFFKTGSWKRGVEADMEHIKNDITFIWNDIRELQSKNDNTSSIVASIKEQLSAIDSKLDLLINGKIKVGE